MTRKVKGTNAGFEVQDLIEEYLNNKVVKNLKKSNLKKFILYICNENRIEIKNDTIIKVKNFEKGNLKIKGPPKADKIFSIENKKFRISIKSGKGTAFHEESEETFLDFLIKSLNANKEIITFLQKFLRDRNQKNKDLKNTEFQNLLKKHKGILINRVLSGIYGEPKVQYYCFCPRLEENDSKEIRIKKIEKCHFSNHTNIMNYLNSHVSGSNCPVGALSFQAQNKKRSTRIQFKWSNPHNDIE
jgi:hypothetical protein